MFTCKRHFKQVLGEECLEEHCLKNEKNHVRSLAKVRYEQGQSSAGGKGGTSLYYWGVVRVKEGHVFGPENIGKK